MLKPYRDSFTSITLATLCLTILTLPGHAVVVSGTGSFSSLSDAVATAGVAVNGINHDGVAEMITNVDGGGSFRSSSALLWTGSHILTAAHSVSDVSGDLNITGGQLTFRYGLGNTRVRINFDSAQVTIHPQWTNDFFTGYDVAIIELDEEVNPFIPRYNIFDGDVNDIIGIEHTIVGFGRTGTGSTGDTQGSGTKRYGSNVYDRATGNSVLRADFDNGLAAQNRYGDLGLGDREANSAPGDSGGPNFVEDPDAPGEYVIAGITSFGSRTSTGIYDINDDIDATFGEMKGDANVTALSDWIIETVGVPMIPEPASGSLLLGAGAFWLLRRRRKEGAANP